MTKSRMKFQDSREVAVTELRELYAQRYKYNGGFEGVRIRPELYGPSAERCFLRVKGGK